MPVAGLNHFNLRAPRALLEELRRFYIEAIGLEEGPRPPFRSRGHWLYAQGRDILHLTESEPDEARAMHVATTFDHIALACTDADAMQARLRRHGVAYAVDDVPMAPRMQVFLRDPAGNGIELNFAMGAQSTDSDGAHGA